MTASDTRWNGAGSRSRALSKVEDFKKDPRRTCQKYWEESEARKWQTAGFLVYR